MLHGIRDRQLLALWSDEANLLRTEFAYSMTWITLREEGSTKPMWSPE
jgi:hypothetical protein